MYKLKFPFRVVASEKNRDASIGISGFSLVAYFTASVLTTNPYRVNPTHLYFDGQGRDVTFAHFLEALDNWFIP